MKKRRRINYKFTERNHSVKGIVSLLFALLSIILVMIMIVISFLNKGNGSMYLGSGGVLSLLIAMLAFVLAIQSMGEEKSYRLFPITATLVSGLALMGGVSLYVVGFLGQ